MGRIESSGSVEPHDAFIVDAPTEWFAAAESGPDTPPDYRSVSSSEITNPAHAAPHDDAASFTADTYLFDPYADTLDGLAVPLPVGANGPEDEQGWPTGVAEEVKEYMVDPAQLQPDPPLRIRTMDERRRDRAFAVADWVRTHVLRQP